MRVHVIKNIIRGVYTRWFSSIRNTFVWMLGGMLFLSASILRAQNTGKWEAINSGGMAVASQPSLDVSQFAGSDIGQKIAACFTALPSTGGTCDARAYWGSGATMTISGTSSLALSGNGGTGPAIKPVILLLGPNQVISCTTSASPCIAFGNHVGIECGVNEALRNAYGCTIETTSSTQTLFGPVNSIQNTEDVHIRGLTLWVTGSSTVPVVDLTNTSFVTIENSGIGHDGGAGDGLFVEVTSTNFAAFHNSVMNSYFFMNGSGNAIHVTNGGNEFNVFGSELQSSTCALNVDSTSSTNPSGTDGVHLFGTSAEAYTDAALCIKPSAGTVYNVIWSGGRFESSTGSVTDVTPSGGTAKEVYMIGPNIDSGQNPPVDAGHAITWLFSGGTASASGYKLPDAITTSHTIGIGGVNQLSANGNLAGSVPLSSGSKMVPFSPGFASAPACTATDTSAANPVRASATASALTLTGTGSDTVAYICVGNPN
jgi:hypothetical protein